MIGYISFEPRAIDHNDETSWGNDWTCNMRSRNTSSSRMMIYHMTWRLAVQRVDTRSGEPPLLVRTK